MTTVAGTTPYAWPYDEAFEPVRTALVVVRGDDAPGVPAAVARLADRLRAAGGVVVSATTTPPRRAAPSAAAGAGADVLTDIAADHLVVAAGIDGFYGSPLDALLRRLGCDRLLLTGSWLETSVHSTLRSANDRGFECLLVLDGCLPFDPALLPAARSQIEMSGGIFGAVGLLDDVVTALTAPAAPPDDPRRPTPIF